MSVDLSFDGTRFPRAAEVRRILYQNASEGISARFQQLDVYDRWYKCLEYAHHEFDWNGFSADSMETINASAAGVVPQGFVSSSTIPVRAKRPTAPKRLCPMVVNRFTGLLFSEGRIPDVIVEDDPESEDFLKAVIEDSLFWGVMHQARIYGGSMKSALVTVRLPASSGKYTFEAVSPKVVQEVKWLDKTRLIPIGVLIQYVTMKEFLEINKDGYPTGNIVQRPYLYRRIIDEEVDLVFKEAPIDGPELPDLELDEMQSLHHKLGFFPGVWIQNLPNSEEIDGIADCEGGYQMLDTIDRLVSQANYALLANMDPTLVLARDQRTLKGANDPIVKGSDNTINVGPQGSATYLEIAGAGIEKGIDLAEKLEQDFLDLVQCVKVDPEKVSGAAQSAKAMEYLYAPMLEKAGRFRSQYGRGIISLLEIALEMGRAFMSKDMYEGVNAKPVFGLPPRVERLDPDPMNPDEHGQTRETPRRPGPGGTISLKWGPYFSPTVQDKQQETSTLGIAKTTKLIDSETAIRQAAPLFHQKDADALIRRVREEEEAQQKKLAELAGGGGSDSPLLDAYKQQQSGEVRQKNTLRVAGASVALPKDPPVPAAGGGQRP